MGIKPKTAALITAGVAVTAGIGYMVYFDHQRRNDPSLKKKLSKFYPRYFIFLMCITVLIIML